MSCVHQKLVGRGLDDGGNVSSAKNPIPFLPGSGKTLAYLAPLISRLRDEEEHHGMVARLCRPRALILLPSRDLAKQILVCMYDCTLILLLSGSSKLSNC